MSPKKDSKQISFGQEKPAVVNTGDVMVDALQMAKDDLVLPAVLKDKTGDGGYIVLTLHRAENVDNKARLASLLTAMADSPLPIILPIHPAQRREY